MTTHRCGRCGTRFEHDAYVALTLVERLEGKTIAEHVVQWPNGTTIDVRACSRCQSPIARMTRAPRLRADAG